MSKRTSTRTIVVSKAFRSIDQDTRKDNINRKLISLEADNYVEAETEVDGEDYESEDEEKGGTSTKRRKTSQSKKNSSSSHWGKRPYKSLERLLYEADYKPNPNSDQNESANYMSIVSAPSKLKKSIQFCSVCGYLGLFSCQRCGTRYCCLKCQDQHKETGCMKQSL